MGGTAQQEAILQSHAMAPYPGSLAALSLSPRDMAGTLVHSGPNSLQGPFLVCSLSFLQ